MFGHFSTLCNKGLSLGMIFYLESGKRESQVVKKSHLVSLGGIQRCIQNSVKHVWWRFLQKQSIMNLKPFLFSRKKLHQWL